jgi:transcription factor STE12
MDHSNVHSIETSPNALYEMPMPTDEDMHMRLAMIDDLKLFLATAPTNWNQDSPIKQFTLPTGEHISCVIWGKLFHITGTDIVRSLMFRFHAFGRPVINLKKFEEGIFSDLRNLKPGTDACLEEPKSEFLDLLYKNRCIRTQKKQKVFYWYSVPHDRLFLDALERDLKREKMGVEPTSVALAHPAKSISLDTTQELFDDLRKSLCLSSTDVYNENLFSGGLCTEPNILQDRPSLRRQNEAIMSWSPPVMMNIDNNPASSGQQINSSWLPVNNADMVNVSSAAERSGMILPSAITSGSVPSLQAEPQKHFSPPLVPSQMPRHPQAKSFHRHAHSVSSVLSADESIESFDESRSTGSRNTISPPQEISPLLLSMTNQNQLAYERSAGIDPIANEFNRLQLANRSTSDSSSSTSPGPADSNSLRKSTALFGMFSLFEGSPSYKQRRRRSTSISIPQPPNRSPPTPNDAVFSRQYPRATYTHNRSSSQPNFGIMHTSVQEQHGHQNHQESYSLSSSSHQFGRNDLITHANNEESGSNSLNRSYICPIPSCARLFKRLEHLKRHLRTHTMERPYVCSICGKRFSRSDNLAQHKKTHDRRRERGLVKTPKSNNENGGDEANNDDLKDPSYVLKSSDITEGPSRRGHSSKRRRGILGHEDSDRRVNDRNIDNNEYEPVSSNDPLLEDIKQPNSGK